MKAHSTKGRQCFTPPRIQNARQPGLRKEKERKYYTFWHQFNEKPGIIPGRTVPGLTLLLHIPSFLRNSVCHARDNQPTRNTSHQESGAVLLPPCSDCSKSDQHNCVGADENTHVFPCVSVACHQPHHVVAGIPCVPCVMLID